MRKSHFTLLYPLISVLWGLGLSYFIYFLARVTFFIENYSLYSDITMGHMIELYNGGLVFDTSAILYTNALWIITILFPLHLKETLKWHNFSKWLFVLINTTCLLINLIDTVYFRFSIRRTTTTIFQEFSNESNLVKIFWVETLNHWYFFLLVIFSFFFLWKLYFKPIEFLHKLKDMGLQIKHYYIFMLLYLILFAPFCVAGMRGGWTRDIRPITISNATVYCNRPSEVGVVLNTPFSLIRTIGKNNFEVVKFYDSKEKLEFFFNPVHQQNTNVLRRNKNIVIIIVESLGREYIGAYNKHIAGFKGFTPFIDSLIVNAALTYRYSYCNGRKSIDAMPSILSSIPMFIECFFLSPYSVNHVSGLAECLNDMGYESAFFHGAERGSMGFMAFARATKFKHYYGREDYRDDSRTRGDKDYDGCWGISDEPFMQYFSIKISEMRQPFLATLFTLSNHHPFRIPEPYKNVFKEENPDMPIYKTTRYTDMALRHFFDTARKQPWFENTIFVITGDHTNMSEIDEYKTDLGGFCSPIIFYDPSGEMGKGMLDGIAQQTDIMPTILNYLGYPHSYVSFGKDLLTTSPNDTWAVNYLNGTYQYVKYGHVLQFDGLHTTAVYGLGDRLMTNNVIGKFPLQSQMECELKAIIQQYMERMIENRLTPEY